MRVLVICADRSQGDIWLNGADEARAIKDAVGDLDRELIYCELSMSTRPQDLIMHLASFEPDVVHFIGHGSPEGVALINPEGGRLIVSGDQLGVVLANRGIRLVVLNSCYSMDQARSLKGVVPTVIGIQMQVADEAGPPFSNTFYRLLRQGRTVSEALRNASDVVKVMNLKGEHELIGDDSLRLVAPPGTALASSRAGDASRSPQHHLPRPVVRSFAALWSGTVPLSAVVFGLAGVLALAIGGPDLLAIGGAVGIAASASLTGSTMYFRHQHGVGGRPTHHPPVVGDCLGGWHLDEQLPAGTTPGRFFLVHRHEEGGVLKLVEHADDTAHRASAQREYRYLRTVRSRHVVRALDGFTWTDMTCVVTEVGSQWTIDDMASRQPDSRPISDAELFSLAAGSITGLADLHAAGLVHRDISPASIEVEHGAATLIDLGASSEAGAGRVGTSGPGSGMSFRSPEQLDGAAVTDKSNVFSWASVMFYLITGQPAAEYHNHTIGPAGGAGGGRPRGASASRGGSGSAGTPDLERCPEWIRPILEAALATSPDERPDALRVQALLASVGDPTWPIRTRTRVTAADIPTRRAAWIAPTAVTGCVVAMVATLALLLARPAEPEPATNVVAAPANSADDEGSMDASDAADAIGQSSDASTSSEPAAETGTVIGTDPFVGVWSGEASLRVEAGAPRLTLVLDKGAEAAAIGAPIGRFGSGNCRGVLRKTSSETNLLAFDHETTTRQAECMLDAPGSMKLSDAAERNEAAYEWGGNESSPPVEATIERSGRVEADDSSQWPTGLDDAPQSFFSTLDTCFAGGGSGCSPNARVPVWTSCNDEVCLAGADDGVDVYRLDDHTYLFSIPPGADGPVIDLMFAGFTDIEALELLE